MRQGLMLALAGSLILAACAGSNTAGGAARIDPIPAEAATPCPAPGDFLRAGDWEVIAGRIGDALIVCEQRRRLAQEAYEGVRRAAGRGGAREAPSRQVNGLSGRGNQIPEWPFRSQAEPSDAYRRGGLLHFWLTERTLDNRIARGTVASDQPITVPARLG